MKSGMGMTRQKQWEHRATHTVLGRVAAAMVEGNQKSKKRRLQTTYEHSINLAFSCNQKTRLEECFCKSRSFYFHEEPTPGRNCPTSKSLYCITELKKGLRSQYSVQVSLVANVWRMPHRWNEFNGGANAACIRAPYVLCNPPLSVKKTSSCSYAIDLLSSCPVVE